jgi:hypothetical protein
MTNYSENPGMVRVDYFKPSGKWYMTEAIDMSPAWDTPDIFDAVRHSLNYAWVANHNGRGDAWHQFTVVILEPYHKNAYPIMIVAKEQS